MWHKKNNWMHLCWILLIFLPSSESSCHISLFMPCIESTAWINEKFWSVNLWAWKLRFEHREGGSRQQVGLQAGAGCCAPEQFVPIMLFTKHFLSPMHCRKSEMTATEEFTVQLFLDSDCKAGTFRFRSTHSFYDVTALIIFLSKI